MGEPISMTAGAVLGLAGLYSVSMQAMQQISDAKPRGDEFQKLHDQFDCQRFLFKEWGYKVRIRDSTIPRHRCLDMSSREYPVVRSILENLQMIWADGDVLSKRYGIEVDPGVWGVVQPAAEQKKVHSVKKVAWTVKDKKRFGVLVGDVGAFVQRMYTIVDKEGVTQDIEAVTLKLKDLMAFVNGMYSSSANGEL